MKVWFYISHYSICESKSKIFLKCLVLSIKLLFFKYQFKWHQIDQMGLNNIKYGSMYVLSERMLFQIVWEWQMQICSENKWPVFWRWWEISRIQVSYCKLGQICFNQGTENNFSTKILEFHSETVLETMICFVV